MNVAIREYHDACDTASMRAVLAVLAACLDRLGCYDPAATIAGFAVDAVTAAWFPEVSAAAAHLRDVLGDQAYESLARTGEQPLAKYEEFPLSVDLHLQTVWRAIEPALSPG
jgi:hypothetical protein